MRLIKLIVSAVAALAIVGSYAAGAASASSPTTAPKQPKGCPVVGYHTAASQRRNKDIIRITKVRLEKNGQDVLKNGKTVWRVTATLARGYKPCTAFAWTYSLVSQRYFLLKFKPGLRRASRDIATDIVPNVTVYAKRAPRR